MMIELRIEFHDDRNDHIVLLSTMTHVFDFIEDLNRKEPNGFTWGYRVVEVDD